MRRTRGTALALSTLVAIAIAVASCGGPDATDDEVPVEQSTTLPTRSPAEPDGPSEVGGDTTSTIAPTSTVWPDFWPCRYTDPARVPLTPQQERACADDAASTLP